MHQQLNQLLKLTKLRQFKYKNPLKMSNFSLGIAYVDSSSYYGICCFFSTFHLESVDFIIFQKLFEKCCETSETHPLGVLSTVESKNEGLRCLRAPEIHQNAAFLDTWNTLLFVTG